MADILRWGIIGTGQIASTFAAALQTSARGVLTAVASRSLAKAESFGNDSMKQVRRYGSYEQLLADPTIDVVYISTPHPMHAKWAIAAAAAKKPLAMNEAEGRQIIEAARLNEVFLMEAFMYRCHPQTQRLAELVRQGAVGEVRAISATFSFDAGAIEPSNRLLDPNLGGGSILDVGCYPASMSRLIAGAAIGQPFAEPEALHGLSHIGPTGVDEWSSAVARFANGIVAVLSCGVRVRQETNLVISGSSGSILCPNPWSPSVGTQRSHLFLTSGDGATTTPIQIDEPRNLYTIEADLVAEQITAGQVMCPAMTWDDTIGNLRLLDRWREEFSMRGRMEA